MSTEAKCTICGQPMPEGEKMFQYHGYSGPCPVLASQPDEETREAAAKALRLGMAAPSDGLPEWEAIDEETRADYRADVDLVAPLLTAPLAARVAEVEAKLAEAERERDEAQRLLATERERADNNIRASDRHRAEREALDWLLPCDAGYQRDKFEREEKLREALRPELVAEIREKWEALKALERASLADLRYLPLPKVDDAE